MSALLIGAAIQGGLGLFQAGAGLFQRRKAMRELNRLEDPTYTIPDSVGQMVDIARRRASSEMPGMDTMRSEMSAQTTAGVQASALSASSQSDLAAATRNLYAEEMRGARQLGIQGAQYRAARESEYMGALGQEAQYQDRAFQINKMMPYERKLRQYMSDAQTGGGNIVAGMNNMVGAATNYIGNKAQLDMMDKWMGRGGTSPAGGSDDFSKKLLASWYQSNLSNIDMTRF